MKSWLIKGILTQTKVIINLYTWSTLPFYAAIQQPWRRLAKQKCFDVIKKRDNLGRLIYSRPFKKPDNCPHEEYFKYETFPQIFDILDKNKQVIGIRDVLQESIAIDKFGKPIMIENRIIKKFKLAKNFRWLTVGQVMDHVNRIARGLAESGITKGTKVLIYAENGIEWFYTLLALSRLNAVVVTLFSTLGDSGVVYGINQSDSQYVVTSQSLLPKLNSLSDQFDKLKSIIYIPDRMNQDIGLEDVEELKKKYILQDLDEIEEIGSKITPYEFKAPVKDDLFMIMYTSGTTGNPKGVMINHGHFQESILNMIKMDIENGNMSFGAIFAAYLPMAHLFGCMMNTAMFMSESKVAFCSAGTLLDSSPSHVPGQAGDIRLIKPEFLVGVPLVLERILKEIYIKLSNTHPLAAPLFTYLMEYKIRWVDRGFDTPIINKLICSKINQQFGGRIRLMGVSSAPIHRYTQSMIQAALNVKIMNGYGATELTGPSHVSPINDIAYENVGVPYCGVKYYLEDWTEGGYSTNDIPNPRGEIVCCGGNVASGYYNLPEETKKAFFTDSNGTKWYRTGDIGEVLPNGTLKVIDRKKDLNKLANGEFISLGKIESALRALPIIENVCVCTNPYLNHVIALIVPNRTQLISIASNMNIYENDNEKLCKHSDVVQRVLESVQRHSKDLGLKVREIPVRIKLVNEEWTQQNNLLTAAFKMRRKQVNDFYKQDIEEMFKQIQDSGDKDL